MCVNVNMIFFFVLYIIPCGVVCLECLFERRNKGVVSCSAAIYEGNNCTNTHLKQLYPELYGQKIWPARPHQYEIQPFDRQYTNGYYYPGVKVIMSPPNTASVTSVKGFEINFQDIEDPGIEAQRCLIINLHNITLTADDRGTGSRVTVDIYPLRVKTFIFDLFSLPKPPNDEITSDLHHLSFLKISRYRSSPDDPSDQWSTTIFYRNISTSKEVHIIFSPPPKKYNFVYFDVKLLKIENPGVERNHEIRSVVQSYALYNQTWYKFEDITPGFYRVSVSPHDHLFYTNYCVCKNGADECTNNCFTTVTGVFQIVSDITVMPSDALSTVSHIPNSQNIETTGNSDRLTELLAVTTEDFGGSPTAEKMNSEQENTGLIMGITIGVSIVGVLIIFIVIVLLIRFIRKRNAQNSDHQYQLGRNNSDLDDTVSRIYKKNERSLITIKKIHIAFAKDHPLHFEVVQMFAKFLETHAYCKVLDFSEEYNYIVNNIEDADNILIINSELAFQHYKAWKDRESYMNDGNTGGNFLNSYRVITKFFKNDPFSYQRVLKINFNYTNYSDENMGAMEQFELMCDMPKLLLNIHGIGSFKDCSKTSEWIDLQRAIIKVSEKQRLQYHTERTDSGNYSSNEDNLSENWNENQATIFQQKQENFSFAETLDSEKLKELAALENNDISESDSISKLKAEAFQVVLDDDTSQEEMVLYLSEQNDEDKKYTNTSECSFIPPEASRQDISSFHQQQEICDLNQRNTPFVAKDVQTIVSGISV